MTRKQILIANCHDSFVYNLVDLLRCQTACHCDIFPIEQCLELDLDRYDGILLSPGPGLPRESPGLLELIARTEASTSLLGVCLGHQAIAEHYGAQLKQIPRPLHGFGDTLLLESITERSHMLESLPPYSRVARYHSWIVDECTLPPCLLVTARSQTDNSIMALQHRSRPIYGVQFHPESFLTEHGASILQHWINPLL